VVAVTPDWTVECDGFEITDEESQDCPALNEGECRQ